MLNDLSVQCCVLKGLFDTLMAIGVCVCQCVCVCLSVCVPVVKPPQELSCEDGAAARSQYLLYQTD